MLAKLNDPYFMDISEIDYKQANIQFSVDELLQHEYLSKRTTNGTQKSSKISSIHHSQHQKRHKQKTISAVKVKDTPRSRKQTIYSPDYHIKNCLPCEERQTQDHSETVKKATVCSPKQLTTPKVTNKAAVNLVASPNKKNQPKNVRSRSKSNASHHRFSAKPSTLLKDSSTGPLISHISPPSTRRISRSGSNAKQAPIEAIKHQHENIIRQDYFDQQQTQPQRDTKNTKKAPRVKATLCKKGENGRKSKKSLPPAQRLGLKSPRPGKK